MPQLTIPRALLVFGCLLRVAVLPLAAGDIPAQPIVIEKQGSFAAGGTVVTAPGTFDPIKHGAFNPAAQETAGQTLRGDHAYVFYQIPVAARPLPLVMWHGYGQSAKTWETTPDGREGFQNIFLRRNYSVYLVDQPRRGRAARSTQAGSIPPAPDEPLWFGIFRIGAWPEFYPGVQFPRDEASLDQFFRQMVPNVGPIDLEVNASAMSALFDRIGPGILVTHSHSGGMGWRTAIKNKNVRAIVAFEPGSNFAFPEGKSRSRSNIRAVRSAAYRCHWTSSRRSRVSRSSFTTGTLSRANRARILVRTSGARISHLPAYGVTPSIATEET